MSINPIKLEKAIQGLKRDLGEGLVDTNIWNSSDAKSVAFDHGYNKKPELIAFFNEVTQKLDKTLKGADFPGLGNYYFINLANNRLAVVLSIDTYQQFILVDLSRTTMGILMSVALPNLLSNLAEAEDEVKGEVETGDAKDRAAHTAKKEKPELPRAPSTLRQFIDAFTKGMYIDPGSPR